MKVKGIKHIDTAVAHVNLGLALCNTGKPAETQEAVALIVKAGKILHRIVADDDPRLLNIPQVLETTQLDLTRFKEPGVLSAWPCWRRPTSRLEDEAVISVLFAEIQDDVDSSNSASMSSEAMQQGLRMYGLFNFTASSSDPVHVTAFVAIACNELQQMKEEANRNCAPAPVWPVFTVIRPLQ